MPLSQASIVARVSLLASMASASLLMRWPRSEGASCFHEGSRRALYAAWTAASTSSAPAAWTVAMSFSVLKSDCQQASVSNEWSCTYAGSIEVIVWPDVALTNSLLMKMPVGWVYLTPLGAWSSTGSLADRAAMVVNESRRKRVGDDGNLKSVVGELLKTLLFGIVESWRRGCQRGEAGD